MSSTPSSLRGLSSITALALLGRPKTLHLRTIELEAQLYLGVENMEHLFGVLRFFNRDDIVFSAEEPRLYIIEASFVQVPEKAGAVPYNASEHDFCGDLAWAIPLGDTDLRSYRPYAHITGLASNCNSTAGTWTVNIEPYISATIKTEPGTLPAPRPRAPFFCKHLEPVGKMKKKPTPYNNRFVAVHGYITDVVLKKGSDTAIEAFKIAVDTIEFLGAEPSSSSSGGPLVNQLDSPATSATPRSKGFGKFKGKLTPISSGTPPTPTPAASGSTRAHNDDDDELPTARRPKRGRNDDDEEHDELSPAIKTKKTNSGSGDRTRAGGA